MYILEAKHIKKNYGGVTALTDASLSLIEGEICGLVGANGSGKTTFAKIICGLERADGGELFFNGKKVKLFNHQEAEENNIALIHQNLSLIPELTVWENVCLGVENTGILGIIKNKEAILRTREIIDTLLPNLDIYQKVNNLSPANKQIVEIAKSLFRNPKILLLDEPTASLEFHEVDKLFEIIKTMKQNKVSVLFISHRIWEINKICDRVVAFRNGKTTGTIDFNKEERDERKIVSLITNSENIPCMQEQEDRRNSIDTRKDLNKSAYLELKAVCSEDKLFDINLNITSGEIIGLGGLQGQGQEELLEIIFGVLPICSGSIILNGESINIRHPKDAIKEGIYYIPGDRQKEGLFLSHNIFSNFIFPKISIYSKHCVLPVHTLINEVKKNIQEVSLHPPLLYTAASNLSGGNQQKIVIGKWISLSPRLLLLNDPTKGVDIKTRTELYRLVSKLATNGTSVILYASDNEELCDNCTRVYIMYEGKIVDELKGDYVTKENILSSSLRISR